LVVFSICKFAEETGRGNAGLPNVLPKNNLKINNPNKKSMWGFKTYQTKIN
jgi:hypothetical protein